MTVSANPAASERRSAVLLLGPTGVGKTPLGEHLQREGLLGRPCAHFDFGANLRGAAAGRLPTTGAPPRGLSAEDLAVIRRVLATGALLTDAQFPIAARLLQAFLAQADPGPAGLVILNGLPRHVGQARAVDDRLRVSALVVLEASAEVVRQRLARDSGGDRAGRVDDDADLVTRKLATYRERTQPLVAHYEALAVPVQRLEVGVETTAAALAARLDPV